jgi:hypothetical protein
MESRLRKHKICRRDVMVNSFWFAFFMALNVSGFLSHYWLYCVVPSSHSEILNDTRFDTITLNERSRERPL